MNDRMPAPFDLSIYRGDDYEHRLKFTDDKTPPSPLDLRSYTFKAQIRDRPEYGKIVYAEFIIDTTDADVGVIVLKLPANSTRFPPGFWDLQVDNGVKKRTWLKGSVNLDGDVTQELSI